MMNYHILKLWGINMKYEFKDKYLVITDKIKVDIDLSKLKGKLARAQNALVNQIIADTTDYVPFRDGFLSNSVHTENENTEIVYNTPYARFLYMGKLMLDDRGSSWAKKGARKHVVNKNLEYSKESHSKAGAKWYERAKEEHLNDWVDVVKKAVGK